ncbi:hypothetical protein JOD20_001902 [Herpetosiphon giganteus]|nr:hypothetical protein [Herpetosiphon giganteus]
MKDEGLGYRGTGSLGWQPGACPHPNPSPTWRARGFNVVVFVQCVGKNRCSPRPR